MKLSLSAISLIAAIPVALASKQRDYTSVRNLASNITAASTVPSSPPCYTVYHDKTLYDDVYCDCGSYAYPPSAVIEVVGPALLDLNGYTVKCSSGYTTEGTIVASGSGAGITNGYVYGSSGDLGDCIYLRDDGYHGVKNVVVYGCDRHCIASAPGTYDNKIVKNYVSYCEDSGIWASGYGDLVKFNSAYHVAYGVVAYYDYITVHSNYVGYAYIGIVALMYGDKIFYNVVVDSGYFGILVEATATYADIRGNKVSGSAYDGIYVGGDYNTIWYNTLFHNDYSGIFVAGAAAGNEIKNNIAYDNTEHDYFDETSCGTNTWYANTGYLLDSCP